MGCPPIWGPRHNRLTWSSWTQPALLLANSGNSLYIVALFSAGVADLRRHAIERRSPRNLDQSPTQGASTEGRPKRRRRPSGSGRRSVRFLRASDGPDPCTSRHRPPPPAQPENPPDEVQREQASWLGQTCRVSEASTVSSSTAAAIVPAPTSDSISRLAAKPIVSRRKSASGVFSPSALRFVYRATSLLESAR
jgi:hypothetical protein